MTGSMRVMRYSVLVCIGLALALCWQAAAWAGAQPKPAPVKAAAAKAKPAVEIKAYYPLNSDHKYIKEYLEKFAKAHPREVSLEFIDTQTSAGRKAWMKTGLSCAGVFVNGKTRHEIKRNGKTETVDFVKRMDVFWSRKDFEAVVNQLLVVAKKGK